MKRGSWGAGERGETALSVSPHVRSRGRELLDMFPAFGLPAAKSLGNIRADRKVRVRGRRVAIDITWLDERIAVGGGIWNSVENMKAVAGQGITHIIDMQIECDDTELAKLFGIEVCWDKVKVDDDFQPKPVGVFECGVRFAQAALEDTKAKLFIHCAAGVHRAPMMALAVLAVRGSTVEDAIALIERLRPVADFAEVYVESVEKFLEKRELRVE